MSRPPLTDPDDDRFCALGQVVERAAVMEIALRMAFCALIGGRNAAVVAVGQETHWLIENCDAVARKHEEISPEQREAIRAALRACRDANRDRNRLVHEAWGTGPGGLPAAMQSVRRSYQIAGRMWNLEEIRATAAAMLGAQQDLLASIEDALGPDSLQAVAHLLAAETAEHRANGR
jgi:hypothetical protein